MKRDIGFWDINGNYILDIQELNEIERKEIMETKNFNEFFDELNDMANFKNFGEAIKDKEFIDNPVIAYEKLKQENAELKEKNTALEETLQTIEQLKDEDSLRIAELVTENVRLKNERTADLVKQIDELKTENTKLNEKILKFKWDNPYFDLYNNVVNQRDMWEQKSKQYKSCLQEIKAIVCGNYEIIDTQGRKDILKLITKAEEE